MDNINYNDFKNICRACLLYCDVKFIQNAVISDIFYKLTDIHFQTNDDLPQQLCLKCFEKIKEIIEFSMQCKLTHLRLMECLNNYENIEIIEETNEPFDENDEITIEENKIEFDIDEKLIWTNEDVINESNNHVVNEEGTSSNIIPNGEKQQIPKNVTNEIENKIEFCPNATQLKLISKNQDCINEYQAPKRIHSGVRPYNCDQCVNTYTSLGNLNRHKRTHSGEHPYKCNKCTKSFIQSASLDYHLRVVHCGERPYKCDECENTYTSLGNLNRHKRMHSGECSYKCDKCPKAYKSLSSLVEHQDYHHRKPYKCNECSKVFTKLRTMKYHKCGLNTFKCDECPKVFIRASGLTIHKRVHNGDRPYKCNKCSQSFMESTSLNYHLRVHSGEHPYKCRQCLKSFTTLGNLKRHKRSHSVKRPYKCNQCSISFTTSSSLEVHEQQVHSGEHP